MDITAERLLINSATLLFILMLLIVPLAYGDIYIKDKDNTIQGVSGLNFGYTTIKADGNGDGDVKDTEDYTKYNEIYISEAYPSVQGVKFRLVYSLEVSGVGVQNIQNFQNKFIEIQGKSYFVVETSSNSIKFATPQRTKVYTQLKFLPANARPILGDVKLGLDNNWNIYIVVNESIVGTVARGDYSGKTDISNNIHEVSDPLDNYKIFISEEGTNYLNIELVDPANLTTLQDGQKNVFGYDYVRVNTDEVPQGSGRIKFFSELYSLLIDSTQVTLKDLPYYTLKMDYDKKTISAALGYIPREVTETVVVKEVTTEWTGGLKIKDYENKITSLDKVRLYPPAVKVDANQDGDIFDTVDYSIYNEIYVKEGGTQAKVNLVYSIQPPMITETVKGNFANLLGMTVPIRDKKYLVTYAEANKITFGESPVEKSLPLLDKVTADSVLLFLDDIRLGISKQPGTLGLLHIYSGTALQGTAELSYLDKDISYKISQATSALDKYVFLLNVSAMSISVVKKDKLTTVLDGSTTVLGYDKIIVNNEEFPDGKGGVKFLSKLYTLDKGNETKLEDYPFYKMQYNSYGEFRIVEALVKKEEVKPEATPTPATIQPLTPPPVSVSTETPSPTVLPAQVIKTSEKLYLKITEGKSEFNKYIDTAGIPGPLKGFASGRFTIHVDDETVGIVLENGRIVEVTDRPIDNPTNEIWTTSEFIVDASASEAPLNMVVEGLNSGEIKKKDYGAANKVKGAVASSLLKVANVLSPPKVVEVREKVSGNVKDVAVSPKEGSYAMSPATSDLRRTQIEIKEEEGKDISGKEINVAEYSGYKTGKAPLGLKKWEITEGEVSLGTFVNIDAPREDIDWTMILMKYSENEMEERGITEDMVYVKWYDDDPNSKTYGEWLTLIAGNPSWVNSIGRDKANDVVWINTSHLSVFGIGGSVYGVSGSVYGASGTVEAGTPVLGPPPSPLPEKPPETLLPIQPIKEVKQSFLPQLFLILAVIAGLAIAAVIVVKRKEIIGRIKKKGKEEAGPVKKE